MPKKPRKLPGLFSNFQTRQANRENIKNLAKFSNGNCAICNSFSSTCAICYQCESKGFINKPDRGSPLLGVETSSKD
ncbi:hypothetical protein, partial [Piscirickettsia litoralis]|uniref:hypothetical protein n=1 Tax=Piscirickettsia litoralis TaxID=1891921 RepID=UPI001F3ABC98